MPLTGFPRFSDPSRVAGDVRSQLRQIKPSNRRAKRVHSHDHEREFENDGDSRGGNDDVHDDEGRKGNP